MIFLKNRKVFVFCLIILFIIIGVIIGSVDTVGQRDYFNNAKNDFEENINNPNYTNLPTIPKKDKTTKIAHKIDNTIYQGFKKILKKMFSSD